MRKLLFACVVLCIGYQSALAADGCMKSREYLLGGMAGDLVMPVAAYANLFKICSAAVVMPNVKNAYILKDGGIAVTPKQGDAQLFFELLDSSRDVRLHAPEPFGGPRHAQFCGNYLKYFKNGVVHVNL